MTEHRLLTGASLHEPKGVETATSDQVYAADGAGSGTWKGRLTGIVNLNSFVLNGTINDVSTTNASFFVAIPTKATLNKFFGVLSGAVITANSVLTIYKNGVAQTPTITIPFTGSGAGVQTTAIITPAIAVNEGDTLEVRSNGGSDNTVSLACALRFTAVP